MQSAICGGGIGLGWNVYGDQSLWSGVVSVPAHDRRMVVGRVGRKAVCMLQQDGY